MGYIIRLTFSLSLFWLSNKPCFSQEINGQVFYLQRHIIEVKGITDYRGELRFKDQIAFYSYSTFAETRAQRDTTDEEGNRYIIPSIAAGSVSTGDVVYTDYATNTLTVAERLKGETFIYGDTIANIDWQLTGEHKTIGSFNCQKAVGAFRGRTYDAWFTPEIPLPYGPWKLSGLPGLILEATTQDGELSFLFEGITIPANEPLELAPPSKGIRLADFRTFREETDRFVEESNKALQARLEKYVRERASDGARDFQISTPHTVRFFIEKTLN